MFKLIAFSALLCVVAAKPGLLAAPYGAYGAYASPLAYHAPVAAYAAPAVVKTVAPLSTSYSNTYKVAVKAPVVAAAPLAYGAYGAYASPALAYGAYHAPAYASAYGATIVH